jgi:hypothetical protein
VNSPFKIEANGGDAKTATLKGNIVVELVYNGQDWGRAETKELKLVNANGRWPWKIAPADVDRMFKNLRKPN